MIPHIQQIASKNQGFAVKFQKANLFFIGINQMFWTKSSIGCTIALHQLWIFPNLFFNLCLFPPCSFLKGKLLMHLKQQPATTTTNPNFHHPDLRKIPPPKKKRTAIPKNPQVVYLHLCRGAGIAINSP